MKVFHYALYLVVVYALTCNLFAEEKIPQLDGDFVQGGLVFGKVTPGFEININKHAVRVSAEGEFVLGFGRDYPEKAVLTVINAQGIAHNYPLKIKQRNYNIQRIDGLPNQQVNPDKETLQRIKTEAMEIKKARSLDEERMDFKANFIWPTKGPLTGVYGSQRILNGEPRQPHYGIDVAAPIGSAVVAPASGLVTYAENMFFAGGTLVVDHGHNVSSSFLHLEKILVQVGDYVQQGEKIALVGATGRVTGAHLDWRMNWHDQRIDPTLLMVGVPNE